MLAIFFQGIGGKAGLGGKAGFGGGAVSVCTNVFSDSFPYGNGNLQTVSTGNWSTTDTPAFGPLIVFSSHVQSNQNSGDALTLWSGAGSFTTNQCSSITFSSVGTDFIGPTVRSTSGGSSFTDTFYSIGCNNAGCSIGKVVAGVPTSLTSSTGTISPGDVIQLSAVGTSPVLLTMKQNGTILQTYSDSSSPITTGVPGLNNFGAAEDSAISNATGGND